MRRLDFVEKETLRRGLPPFRVGDTVRVHARIREGEKDRIQVFEGVVIRRRGGGASETFTVRKISNGVGVERIFPVQSPLVSKVEIKSRGHVRRSRLYYLRELRGKKARLQSKVRNLSSLLVPEEVEPAEEAARPAEPEAGAEETTAETTDDTVVAEEAPEETAEAEAVEPDAQAQSEPEAAEAVSEPEESAADDEEEKKD